MVYLIVLNSLLILGAITVYCYLWMDSYKWNEDGVDKCLNPRGKKEV